MTPFPGVTLHARERFPQRFGFTPTREEWGGLVLSIVERRALLLYVQPGGIQTWLAELRGVEVAAVWAPEAAVIVTVQPRWMRPNIVARAVDHERTLAVTDRRARARMERRA